MKNIALILAGGVGKRVQSDIPKQFIEVNKKPIIIYTLERFQSNNNIDAIVVVCRDEWIDILNNMCDKYKITKFIGAAKNNKNLFFSTKNGLEYIKTYLEDKDAFVIIHESVRPIITDEMITDSINVAHKYGCAVAGFKNIDECGYSLNNSIDELCDNTNAYTLINPHTFLLSDLIATYVDKNEVLGNQGTAVLMYNLGKKIYMSKGIQDCFKITTSIDIKRFEKLLELYK